MYDIVIVGASFAGLILAHHLPRKYKILIIDNKKEIGLPVKSTGLITQATKDMLGEFFDIDSFITNKMDSLCVVSPNFHDYFVSSVDEPWIYTTDTNAMICELAELLPHNVEIQTGKTFLEYDPYFLKVTCDKGGDIYARFVVGADGGHSSVARDNLNLDQNEKFLIGVEKIIYGKVLLGKTPEKAVYHYWFGDYALGYGGWIASTKVEGKDVLRIGFALYPDELSKKVTIDNFISLLQSKGHIEISQQREISSFANLIPIGGPLKKIYNDNTLLIGDAAGYCGSFAADGIKGAVLSAKIAAKLIPQHFAGDRRALRDFHKEMQKENSIMSYYRRQKNYRRLWDFLKTSESFQLVYELVEKEKTVFLKTYCDSKDKHKSLMRSLIKVKNIPKLIAIGLSLLSWRHLTWSVRKRLSSRANEVLL
jgi:digeranylgeranylglycerophospholipid reductase